LAVKNFQFSCLRAHRHIIFADTSGLFSGDRFINVLNFISVVPYLAQISGTDIWQANGFQNPIPKYVPYKNAKK